MIILRQIEPEDLDWLRDQRNREELMQYFNQFCLFTLSDQKKWYEGEVLTKKCYPFIVWDDKVPIGYCILRDFNWVVKEAEFGIFIIPEQQNKGYGKKSLLTLLKFGFENLNLHRIYSTVFEFNKAIGIYKKLGFTVEGILRDKCYKNGTYWDAYAISILRDDYDDLYYNKSKC